MITLFKEKIKVCGLEEIYACTDVEVAAELLTSKITEVLDTMAPIKKIQTRNKYAPWLSEDTKHLKAEREAAQERAAESDDPEDWRAFRALRNQVTKKCREDKKKWEKEKLDPNDNTTTDVWKTVKGWLGWGTSGTPTQLFWEGRLVTSPRGLCTTMNRFVLDKIIRLRPAVEEETVLKYIKGLKTVLPLELTTWTQEH